MFVVAYIRSEQTTTIIGEQMNKSCYDKIHVYHGDVMKYIVYSFTQLLMSSNLICSVGAKLRYMGYLASLLHPQEEKNGYYFQSGTCLGALETHVLLSFLWSIFCKWPVINVTPQTMKITVHKIQD